MVDNNLILFILSTTIAYIFIGAMNIMLRFGRTEDFDVGMKFHEG